MSQVCKSFITIKHSFQIFMAILSLETFGIQFYVLYIILIFVCSMLRQSEKQIRGFTINGVCQGKR